MCVGGLSEGAGIAHKATANNRNKGQPAAATKAAAGAAGAQLTIKEETFSKHKKKIAHTFEGNGCSYFK